MPGLKDVQNKIVGVKKTSQITQAMNMVASAKLRGAQEKMEAFRPYAAKFTAAMSNLSAGGGAGDAALMEARDEIKTVEILVITSDRGLCGSFNSNILRLVEKETAALEAEGKKVSYVCVGRKGEQGLKKTGKVRETFLDIMATFQMFNAREICQSVAHNFLEGNADEVRLVYGSFINVAVQRPVMEQLLPIQPVEQEDEGESKEAGGGIPGVYTYEPEPEDILEVLLPLYLNVKVYSAMLEVGASEHAARMTAMDNATNACKDMIDELTQLYNKARQAAITGDLMDIVGGAEALKG